MHAHLFFNPAAASGNAAMRLGAALAHLRTLGVHVELHRPGSAADARSEMRALAGHVERVLVVGGDGMVHQAANALVGSSTILGIIAAGTGNDAAASLGLSDDIDEACAAALRDPVRIDLIDSGTEVAVTVATSGFSVAVNDRANEMQRVKSGLKYTLSSLIELPKLASGACTMTLDGVEHQVEANLIAVANTQYFGGGMKIAPDARVDDGLLDVVVVGPTPRIAFAAILPTVFSGRHITSRYVKSHRVARVEFSNSDATWRADGEEFGSSPVSFSVRPKALAVAGANPA